MQLAIRQKAINKLVCDNIKVIIFESEETKEGNGMNDIITMNGIALQILPFVYPNLKSIGICNPTIVVKINRDKLIPMKLSIFVIVMFLKYESGR